VVLLPLAIQTVHAFKKHEYSATSKQVSINLFDNEIDCSCFHFKSNHHVIVFSSEETEITNSISTKNFCNFEVQIASKTFSFKTSRAPPILLS